MNIVCILQLSVELYYSIIPWPNDSDRQCKYNEEYETFVQLLLPKNMMTDRTKITVKLVYEIKILYLVWISKK